MKTIVFINTQKSGSSREAIKEAEKMGFQNAIIPERNREKVSSENINVIGVSNLREVINKIF